MQRTKSLRDKAKSLVHWGSLRLEAERPHYVQIHHHSMEAPALQSRFRFPRLSSTPRLCETHPHQCKVDVPESSPERFHSSTVKKVLRRSVVQFLGLNSILFKVCTVTAATMQETRESDAVRTLKLASGVRIQDIIEGEGSKAHEGDLVEINYVCRRANGYFVHSTVDHLSGESTPIVLPLDDKQIIKGLKEVLTGMRAGGKRRALIPPSVGYISKNLKPIPEEFGPRRSLSSHANEPLVFEVQLLRVL